MMFDCAATVRGLSCVRVVSLRLVALLGLGFMVVSLFAIQSSAIVRVRLSWLSVVGLLS